MGSTITAETIIDGTNTTHIEYFYGSYGPYGFSIDGTFYYYVKNLQGDVMQIREENNTLIASYVYDAWGKVLSVTENNNSNIGAKNAIRYRGYYYDTESNISYATEMTHTTALQPQSAAVVQRIFGGNSLKRFPRTNRLFPARNQPKDLTTATGCLSLNGNMRI